MVWPRQIRHRGYRRRIRSSPLSRSSAPRPEVTSDTRSPQCGHYGGLVALFLELISVGAPVKKSTAKYQASFCFPHMSAGAEPRGRRELMPGSLTGESFSYPLVWSSICAFGAFSFTDSIPLRADALLS